MGGGIPQRHMEGVRPIVPPAHHQARHHDGSARCHARVANPPLGGCQVRRVQVVAVAGSVVRRSGGNVNHRRPMRQLCLCVTPRCCPRRCRRRQPRLVWACQRAQRWPVHRLVHPKPALLKHNLQQRLPLRPTQPVCRAHRRQPRRHARRAFHNGASWQQRRIQRAPTRRRHARDVIVPQRRHPPPLRRRRPRPIVRHPHLLRRQPAARRRRRRALRLQRHCTRWF